MTLNILFRFLPTWQKRRQLLRISFLDIYSPYPLNDRHALMEICFLGELLCKIPGQVQDFYLESLYLPNF